MFGTTGRLKAMHFNNLPEEDKVIILQDTARSLPSSAALSEKNQLDFSAKALRPDLKLELNDQFRASTINVKFVAFRTPKQLLSQNI